MKPCGLVQDSTSSRIGDMEALEYSKHVSHSLNSEDGGRWDLFFLPEFVAQT